MLKTGTQLKLDGLELAASKHGPDMARALLCAELLAMDGSIITTDDVREKFLEIYQRPLRVGNALGGLFKFKKKWEFCGFINSKRPESHARAIRTWRLKQPYKQPSTESIVGTDNGVRFCQHCLEETTKCECHDSG